MNAHARALGPLLVLNAHGWSHQGLSHAPVLGSGSLPEAQTLSPGTMWWPCPQPWLWLSLLAASGPRKLPLLGAAVPQPLLTGYPQPRASLAALYQTHCSPSLFGNSHLTEHLCKRPKSAAWSEFCWPHVCGAVSYFSLYFHFLMVFLLIQLDFSLRMLYFHNISLTI